MEKWKVHQIVEAIGRWRNAVRKLQLIYHCSILYNEARRWVRTSGRSGGSAIGEEELLRARRRVRFGKQIGQLPHVSLSAPPRPRRRLAAADELIVRPRSSSPPPQPLLGARNITGKRQEEDRSVNLESHNF